MLPNRKLPLVALSVLLAGPATAKDLLRLDHHDEPAKRATGCEWAGQGFAKLPGTDTCVRVGGSVQAEYAITSTGPAYRAFGR